MEKIAGEFRVLCDRCGSMYSAQPYGNTTPPLQPNRVTVATVEFCAVCVGHARPVSHRVLFLIDCVKQLEDFKRKYPNG